MRPGCHARRIRTARRGTSAQEFAASAVATIGDFNLDFERGDGSAAIHLDLHLVGLDCHMARDGGQDLFLQDGNQVGAAERRAFVREQDLQPLARDRRGVALA